MGGFIKGPKLSPLNAPSFKGVGPSGKHRPQKGQCFLYGMFAQCRLYRDCNAAIPERGAEAPWTHSLTRSTKTAAGFPVAGGAAAGGAAATDTCAPADGSRV